MPRTGPRPTVATIAIALTLLVSGCGKKEDTMQPTISAGQASARIDAVIDEAKQQLPPGTELKPHSAPRNLPCDDPTDGGPAGRIFVEKQYEVKLPAGAPADQTMIRLAGYWQQKSYRIHDDGRNLPDPRLAVETPDGYRAILKLFVRGPGLTDVYLTGSSPCVWEFGTPNPQ